MTPGAAVRVFDNGAAVGYANPIERYGVDRFVSDAKAAGVAIPAEIIARIDAIAPSRA